MQLFWKFEKGIVNQQKAWDCDPIEGTRKLHCFDGFSKSSPILLLVRDRTCFYLLCVDGEEESDDGLQ